MAYMTKELSCACVCACTCETCMFIIVTDALSNDGHSSIEGQ